MYEYENWYNIWNNISTLLRISFHQAKHHQIINMCLNNLNIENKTDSHFCFVNTSQLPLRKNIFFLYIFL